jgi:hypothetical protein
MRHVLNIVASCSDTKATAPPPELRLRSVHEESAEARGREWLRRLELRGLHNHEAPAAKVYRGVYWSNVLRLVDTADALLYEPRLWIASAGYGLIRSDTPIAPYAATFTAGLPDSVSHDGGARGSQALRAWWKHLQAEREGDSRTCRNLADLVLAQPDSSVLVLGSPAYMDAMSDDLAAAVSHLPNPQRLVIVSSNGAIRGPALAANFVANDARLCTEFGGALVAIHAKTARFVVEHAGGEPLMAAQAAAAVSRLIDAQPAFCRPSRTPQSDEDVIEFISRELRLDSQLRPSPLLRRFRAANFQCEQSRFKALHARVTRGEQ